MGYGFPIVVVEWLDAVSHGDGDGQPRHKPARLRAIGWLLQYDDNGISIAYEYSEDDHSWRCEQFIPSSLIVNVDQLEPSG